MSDYYSTSDEESQSSVLNHFFKKKATNNKNSNKSVSSEIENSNVEQENEEEEDEEESMIEMPSIEESSKNEDMDNENATGNNNQENEEEEDEEDEEESMNEMPSIEESNENEDIDNENATGNNKLADLHIIKTVGEGGFGRVLLCIDKGTNNYVAVKVMAMANLLRSNQQQQVIKERNILAKIVHHPFLINFKWSAKDDFCLYLVMEYVNGGELATYMHNAVRLKNETGKCN